MGGAFQGVAHFRSGLIGPRPKISPESAALLFFHLLSVQGRTRKSHSVEAAVEGTRESEGNHRGFRGEAKFVEGNVQPFLSIVSSWLALTQLFSNRW
jgi:hypothetical protein